MRNDSANQGGEPGSVTLDNTLSDTKLTVLAVLGDCLEESTNLVLLGHVGSQTGRGPLINHLDLMVKFLAVLVPVPAPGLPLVLHLLDCLVGQVAFLSCSVNANKMSLASKKCLVTTVVLSTLLGDKMTLSGGILEGDKGKLENNLIIMTKRFSPFSGLVTSLSLG